MNEGMTVTIDDSILSEELAKITSDMIESSLDTLLEEGWLKNLPIIGTLVSMAKVGVGIQQQFFVKKLLKFLFEIKSVTQDERTKFLKRVNSQKDYKVKVGESLMLLIDKFNDYTKAEYFGKLFKAVIEGKIDYQTFLKLGNILDKSFLPDLNGLVHLYKGSKTLSDVDRDSLYNLGLLTSTGVDGGTYIYQRTEDAPKKPIAMEINKYGILIVNLILLSND